MQSIENHIRENIDLADAFPVPEGSRDVFLGKVAAEKRRRGARRIVAALWSMAAAAAIAVFLFPRSLANDIERHHRRLAFKETEILTVISRTSPESLEEVRSIIRAVTSEAVPLEEQLPEIMNKKDRESILEEYYDIKYRALEMILEQYTETN